MQVAIFFVSFIVVNGIFVLNVVIAVLLDEFIGAVDREKKREKDLEQVASESVSPMISNRLEPELPR